MAEDQFKGHSRVVDFNLQDFLRPTDSNSSIIALPSSFHQWPIEVCFVTLLEAVVLFMGSAR